MPVWLLHLRSAKPITVSCKAPPPVNFTLLDRCRKSKRRRTGPRESCSGAPSLVACTIPSSNRPFASGVANVSSALPPYGPSSCGVIRALTANGRRARTPVIGPEKMLRNARMAGSVEPRLSENLASSAETRGGDFQRLRGYSHKALEGGSSAQKIAFSDWR